MSIITHALLPIDFYKRPEVLALDPGENIIYEYCIRHSAENNMGIFREERGVIAFFTKTNHDLCYNFFLKYPDLINFCPETHLIWVKKFYQYVRFGIDGDIYKYVYEVDKKTKKKTQVQKLNINSLTAKNNFIDKIKKELRTNCLLKNHRFVKEWVKYNFPILEKINEEVKLINGNGRNFDEVLALIK